MILAGGSKRRKALFLFCTGKSRYSVANSQEKLGIRDFIRFSESAAVMILNGELELNKIA
jgi:predicted mannosyl-3-phosphoglycerate phosphatase (HAD superfamily)